ncbi:MAG: S-layer homology domain-containing protein, partial [Clostridiales bacterium]|nr:S-layer homology domain-containing protein [Clostridiales bacterium]
MSAVSLTNSVILGGDVVTPKFEYTGDNWFYQPTWLLNAEYGTSLRSNIDRSIKCTMEYISKYVSKNGKDYLFVLVVCTATEAYHAGVDFVINNGYMVGMSETEFGVNSSLTRGQLVTILYRLAGEPTVEGKTNPFTDVAKNRYYTNAVIWGASEGIVNGVTDTTFAPNQPVTREQIATFLYRYSGE